MDVREKPYPTEHRAGLSPLLQTLVRSKYKLDALDNRKVEIARFEEALEIIARGFPYLRIEVDRDHPHVEALAEIRRQPGLDFDVSINLQNCDELHLNAGELWVSWFPCGRQDVFDKYIEAVLGVLSGDFRVVEYSVLGERAKAELQKPKPGGSWQTVSTSAWPRALIPWKRTKRIVQNRRLRDAASN